jgi:hypothetical protein
VSVRHHPQTRTEFIQHVVLCPSHSPTPSALFGHPNPMRFLHARFVATNCGLFMIHYVYLRTYDSIHAVYTRVVHNTHGSKKHVFWGFFQKPHYDQMSESFDRLHIEKPEGTN